MNRKKPVLTRRDFLKACGLALGGSALACAFGDQVVGLKATVVPPAGAMPLPELKPGEFADIVLTNGNLLTMEDLTSSAQALAIKGKQILQVGSNDSVQSLIGDGTRVIDLTGRTVSPGLIDAHNHLQVWGTMLEQFVELNPPGGPRSLDDFLATLSDAVAAANSGDWVQGYYWQVDPMPDRYDLDSVAPDNPVFIIQQGGHFGVANSKALKIAEIDAKTKNPEGGVIERDESGEPTGVLYNHRALDMVRVHAPQPTVEQMFNNLRHAEELMAAVGVTTFQDCNARFSALEAYMRAGREHATMLRAEIFYTLEWPSDLERALNEIPYYSDDFVRFAGYKFLIDGQFPTWYTHEPHPGIRWDMPTWDPKNFKKAVRQLHDTGLQIAVHCGGDAAVDLALEAYEEAMNVNSRPDPRHRIEHATLTKPHATQKAADLGVQISCQPQFLRFSGNLESQLGAERAGRIKVTREWLDAGINVALGSDTPTAPWYEPHVTLVGAVARLGPDDKPVHPEQAMTIQEALYAHTMGSAKAAFEENIKGSLTPGKYADLVVWSQNFYDIDLVNNFMEMENVVAEMTMIEGQVIHEAETG